MFTVSFISVMIVLGLRGGLGVIEVIVIAIVTAVVSAVAELCSKNGNDTVICPMLAMAVLVPLVYIFERMV